MAFSRRPFACLDAHVPRDSSVSVCCSINLVPWRTRTSSEGLDSIRLSFHCGSDRRSAPEASLLRPPSDFEPDLDEAGGAVDMTFSTVGQTSENADAFRVSESQHVLEPRAGVYHCDRISHPTARRKALEVALHYSSVFRRSEGAGRATTRKNHAGSHRSSWP